ncbi:YeeE/YedE family protein [Rhizobium sp. TH2]|uniref:DUF6691 family protein n=1 Tax=Rhizobium sp. TH2 TaxID=2775403 RepID=UPI0021571039|nr:DUF6691 family protein [Rhizobium sp. TH2]UVC09714.1 YeeE/YedE family protein [Rhizobium sp. TH2]
MKYLSALLIGAVFGIGIAISGMGNPAKVQNFFDLAGTWDPSLAFVMAGALAAALPGYALIFRRRQKPVLELAFSLPTRSTIDARLVGGSAVFGIGWGIVGFCPGGAIPVIGLVDNSIFIFLAAMITGMLLARTASGILNDRARAAEVTASG